MTQKNRSTKQINRCREQTGGCQVWEREWRKDGLGVWAQQVHTILYVECINKFPLCCTGDYIQYSVTKHKGKEYIKNTYVCITEALCCTAEINTTL